MKLFFSGYHKKTSIRSRLRRTTNRFSPLTNPHQTPQDDEKKFLLLPEDGNHDVAIFDPGSGVQLGTVTLMLLLLWPSMAFLSTHPPTYLSVCVTLTFCYCRCACTMTPPAAALVLGAPRDK